MNWTATVGEYTVTTAAWPLWISAAGPVLALVAVLLSILLWGRGLGRPVLAINLGFVAVFAGLAAGGLPSMFAGMSTVVSSGTALRVFRDLAMYEGAAAAAGVTLGIGAIALWVGTPRSPDGVAVPWERIGLVAAAFVASGVGVFHVVWLTSVGELPLLEPDLPSKIHVNQTLDVEYAVAGWDVPTVHTMAGASGKHTFVLSVSRRGVVVSRPMSVEAGLDRLDEGLRLKVGDEWVYESTTSWHDQLMWFISSPGRATGPLTRVRVTGERHERARRLIDVEVTSAGEVETYAILPWEGKALLEDGETVFWSLADTRSEDGSYACTFAAFPGGCACEVKTPGDPLFLPGATRCTWSTSSAINTGVSLFLAVVTVGLVLDDPNRTHFVELVASGNGPQMPDTAFAAPPPEPPSP